MFDCTLEKNVSPYIHLDLPYFNLCVIFSLYNFGQASLADSASAEKLDYIIDVCLFQF